MTRYLFHHKKLKFLLIFLLFVCWCLIFYADSLQRFIGGDDVWNLVDAPVTMEQLRTAFVTDISTYYRPILKTFFLVYKILPYNLALWHVPQILLFAGVMMLFFLVQRNVFNVKEPIAFIISVCWSVSHIVFINVYTLTGISESIFLILCLLSLLCWNRFMRGDQKSLWITTGIIILSFFSKESALILPLLCYILFVYKKNRFFDVPLLILLFPTSLFYLVKLNFVKPINSAYTYDISWQVLLINGVNFVTWLTNIRHGWQMGMPLPPSIWYQLFIITSFMFFVVACVYLIFKRRPFLLFCLFAMGIGFLPYIFLSRTLVYYVNISYLFYLLLIGTFLSVLTRKKIFYSVLCMLIYLFLNLWISSEIKQQWIRYSFVAVAQETAQNYFLTFQQINWQQVETLCIVNADSNAMWSINQGKLLYFFIPNRPAIQLYNDSSIEKSCQGMNTVIIKNDVRRFMRIGQLNMQ